MGTARAENFHEQPKQQLSIIRQHVGLTGLMLKIGYVYFDLALRFKTNVGTTCMHIVTLTVVR